MTGDSSGAGDTSRLFRRLHGAEIRPEGGVRFRIWAPAYERISPLRGERSGNEHG